MRLTNGVAARTATFILAGGEGRRLSPLTKYRPKPLVPFGGCYRIVDFTLSNCLNSALKRVHVLTQHASESIGTYLRKGWGRAGGSNGEFVLHTPAISGKRYAGTADAVLQNFHLMEQYQCEFALVLSADHIYTMDYRDLLNFHVASGAEVTIATVDRPKECSTDVGVLEVENGDRVIGFEEKPRHPRTGPKSNGMISASMGIYVFNRDVLWAALTGGRRIIDFANDLIPELIGSREVRAYRHEDWTGKTPLYWRDVGTPEAYYASSMDLLAYDPSIDPQNADWPVRSGDRAQPGTRSGFSAVGSGLEVNSIIPDGANIGPTSVYHSVLFPSVVLKPGAIVRHSVLMPGVVIGRGASVRRAIIDANVVIDAGDDIGYDAVRDRRRFHVLSNGIVVVSPDHVLPFRKRDTIHRVPHSWVQAS